MYVFRMPECSSFRSTLQLKIKRKLLEKACTFEERCKKKAPVARAGKLVSALRTASNASFPVVTRFRQKKIH